jgi:tetratricopeptide (TPR) repeat protein
LKGKAVDARQIGRDLNVRYVLEGSVQRGGNRFRLNVQLTDTETGSHVWADRFDKPAAELLDMQDEIVSRLANTLNAELIAAEARRAERSPRPDAMDLYFQGRALQNRGVTRTLLAQARDFFARSLALDPGNIEAAVAAAQVDVSVGSAFMADDVNVHFDVAEAALNSALLHAPNHPRAHMLLGAVQIQTGRIPNGIAQCRRSLALDRNLADAHGFIGLGKYQSGHSEEVEGHIQRRSGCPRAIRDLPLVHVCRAGQVEHQRRPRSRRLVSPEPRANRNHALSHFHFATALALVGDLKEARSIAEAGLALDPAFTIRRYRINAKGDNPIYLARRQRYFEGCASPACRRAKNLAVGQTRPGWGRAAPWPAPCHGCGLSERSRLGRARSRRERDLKGPESRDLRKAIRGVGRDQPYDRGRNFLGYQPADRSGLTLAQLDFLRARRGHRGPDAADRRLGISIVDRNRFAGQVGDRLDVGTRHQDGDERVQRRIQGRSRHSFRGGGGGRHLFLCRSGLRNLGR